MTIRENTAAIYFRNFLGRLEALIKYSLPNEEPTRIVVSLAGKDAELFNNLVAKLGSEKRAQDAIILEGFMTKVEKSHQLSKKEIKNLEEMWPKIVGITRRDFENLAIEE